MRFRPCIDIHNGKVKQIVGGSLLDAGNYARENFVSGQDSVFYAELFKERGLVGGHVILLNDRDSKYYEQTREQAMAALRAYPGGLQVGGGITPENAEDYLQAGASHVIVTSYVFSDGEVSLEHLREMERTVSRERLVLDLSCRKRGGDYYIVTDRWQVFTNVRLTGEVLSRLGAYCDEILVHGVDVEGKCGGVEQPLVRLLGEWAERPVTYAGGIRSVEDLEVIRRLGNGNVDFTVGSALDLYGGTLPFETVCAL